MSQGAALLYISLSVIIGVLSLVAWASIFSKAGHSSWLCLLFLVPLVNVILFFWFAFSEWPISRRRDTESTPPSQ